MTRIFDRLEAVDPKQAEMERILMTAHAMRAEAMRVGVQTLWTAFTRALRRREKMHTALRPARG